MKRTEETINKKDVWSWALLLIFTLAFFLLLANATRQFLIGVFGWSAYAYIPTLIIVQLLFVMGYRINVPKNRIVAYVLLVVFATLSLHIMLAKGLISSDESYILSPWQGYGTVGGMLVSIITSPLILVLGYGFSLAICFVLTAVCGLIILYPHIATYYAKAPKKPAKSIIKKNPTPVKLDDEPNYIGLNVQDINAMSAQADSNNGTSNYAVDGNTGSLFSEVLFAGIKTEEALLREQQVASINQLAGKTNNPNSFPEVFGGMTYNNTFATHSSKISDTITDKDYYPEVNNDMQEQRRVIDSFFKNIDDTSPETYVNPLQGYANNFSNLDKKAEPTVLHTQEKVVETSNVVQGESLTNQVESFHEAVQEIEGMGKYTEADTRGYMNLFGSMIKPEEPEEECDNAYETEEEYGSTYGQESECDSTNEQEELEPIFPQKEEPLPTYSYVNTNNSAYQEVQRTEEVPTIAPVVVPQVAPVVAPQPVVKKEAPVVAEKTEKVTKPKRPYQAPPITLLDSNSQALNPFPMNFNEMKIKIESILKELGIEANVIDAVQGPAFTRYEIKLGAGVSPKKITNNDSTIKMRLKVDSLNILAPIPGKDAVGFEIENEKKVTVGLSSVICSKEFHSLGRYSLPIPVGQTIDAKAFVTDLASMPHLLVAGATGKGKSVFINSLIMGLLFSCTPDEVRLLLIDPKRVETVSYTKIPHLLMSESVKDPDEAVNLLGWLTEEMDRRYKILEASHCRNIIKFNDIQKEKGGQTMYRIVLILDEMSDLMARAGKTVENDIVRLAQLGRASGIHLVLATQRPTVNVITGLIKANITNSVAFAVKSNQDSRIIIDQGGAENLFGKGDLLFGGDKPFERIQGCYVSDEEIDRVCDFLRDNNDADFDDELALRIAKKEEEPVTQAVAVGDAISSAKEDWEKENEDMLKEVLKAFIISNKATPSVAQTACSLGYPRASKIVRMLEGRGYISTETNPATRSRDIYITMDQFIEEFGE